MDDFFAFSHICFISRGFLFFSRIRKSGLRMLKEMSKLGAFEFFSTKYKNHLDLIVIVPVKHTKPSVDVAMFLLHIKYQILQKSDSRQRRNFT